MVFKPFQNCLIFLILIKILVDDLLVYNGVLECFNVTTKLNQYTTVIFDISKEQNEAATLELSLLVFLLIMFSIFCSKSTIILI